MTQRVAWLVERNGDEGIEYATLREEGPWTRDIRIAFQGAREEDAGMLLIYICDRDRTGGDVRIIEHQWQ